MVMCVMASAAERGRSFALSLTERCVSVRARDPCPGAATLRSLAVTSRWIDPLNPSTGPHRATGATGHEADVTVWTAKIHPTPAVRAEGRRSAKNEAFSAGFRLVAGEAGATMFAVWLTLWIDVRAFRSADGERLTSVPQTSTWRPVSFCTGTTSPAGARVQTLARIPSSRPALCYAGVPAPNRGM